jgi:hypothetical protein
MGYGKIVFLAGAAAAALDRCTDDKSEGLVVPKCTDAQIQSVQDDCAGFVDIVGKVIDNGSGFGNYPVDGGPNRFALDHIITGVDGGLHVSLVVDDQSDGHNVAAGASCNLVDNDCRVYGAGSFGTRFNGRAVRLRDSRLDNSAVLFSGTEVGIDDGDKLRYDKKIGIGFGAGRMIEFSGDGSRVFCVTDTDQARIVEQAVKDAIYGAREALLKLRFSKRDVKLSSDQTRGDEEGCWNVSCSDPSLKGRSFDERTDYVSWKAAMMKAHGAGTHWNADIKR